MSVNKLPERLRVAVLQFDIRRGDPDANLATVAQLLDAAAGFEPHLAVLPEMWTASFCGQQLVEEAWNLSGRVAWLAEQARARDLWILAGSLPEMPGPKGDQSRVYNTVILLDAAGVERYRYRKMHLFPLTGEDKFFVPGESLPDPFVSGPWTIAAAVCFDLRFPELFRAHVRRGTNLWLVPAQWPDPRGEHFTGLASARALENEAYVITCNRVGSEGKLTFPGASQVIEPFGTVVAGLHRQPGVVLAELDAARVAELRKSHPFLDQVRLLPR